MMVWFAVGFLTKMAVVAFELYAPTTPFSMSTRAVFDVAYAAWAFQVFKDTFK